MLKLAQRDGNRYSAQVARQGLSQRTKTRAFQCSFLNPNTVMESQVRLRTSLSIDIMLTFFAPGRYVPIARGVMRTKWFPSKIARYAVDEELKAIRDGKIIVERDFEFGLQEQLKPQESKIEEVQVEQIQEAPKVEGIKVYFQPLLESALLY